MIDGEAGREGKLYALEVCMYVCVCTMQTLRSVYIHACIHTHIRTYINTYTCRPLRTPSIHTYLETHMYTYIFRAQNALERTLKQNEELIHTYIHAYTFRALKMPSSAP